MSSRITKKEKKPVEVIVFEDPARRNKNKSEKSASTSIDKTSSNSNTNVNRPVFDQKAAKYDIRKLAMQGMDKSEQEVAMADFLVELGAKKTKNKHVPIKDYLQDVKKRKLEGGDKNPEEKDQEKDKKPKFKRKRDKDDVLGFVDGQIGTYKRGVQFIKGGKSGGKRRKKF